MRKNFLLVMIAAVTMLFATSCQKEELGTEVTVSFALSQPGIATKTYSDGKTAEKLSYAVYLHGPQGAPVTLSEDEVTFVNKRANVNLRLVTGQTYDIVFWADAGEASPYTFDATNREITVDYEGADSQDETRDAFFAVVEGLEVEGAINRSVTLKRPFAQLNLGTTDAEEATVNATYTDVTSTYMKSSVAVSGVYSTLNLMDGTVADQIAEPVLFALAAIPEATETFPVEGATYLSMNYLLVSADNDLVDVDFTVTDAQVANQITRQYTNVPVKRNYRTNIYGKLLTDPAAFDITIDPAYEEPNVDIDLWDGITITEPDVDADGSYLISNGAELAWIAAQFNGRTDAYSGIQSIKLVNDIDLNSMPWTPINAWDAENTAALVFDGQGYKIKNMRVESSSKAGFIGNNTRNWTISNLTFENPVVISSGSHVGTVIGYQYGNVTMNNVKVTGANVETTAETGIRVGGLVGYSVLIDGANLALTNCTVENSTITGYHNVAGLVGTLIQYTAREDQWEFTGNNVTGCTFNVTNANPANVKYASPFAVEGSSYPHTYDESITYFTGNTESNNTFDPISGIDLGTGVVWAPTAYGVTPETPYGEYMTVAEASNIPGYRLPTQEEARALITNCTWTKTTVNGVSGYSVVSNTTGQEIFMPAAYNVHNFPDGTLYTIVGLTGNVIVAITDLQGIVEVSAYWTGASTEFPVYLVVD